MGLQLMGTHLSMHPEVEQKTLMGLLRLIEQERQGDAVDRALLKVLLRMFSLLGIYATGFQTPFLEQTKQFYKAESERYMEQADVPEYLIHCEVSLGDLSLDMLLSVAASVASCWL